MSAVSSIVNLVFKVIALFFSKLSKWFLYIFVPLNHLSNLSDPLTKQNAVNNKNGVVGNIGKIIPINPNPKEIKPKIT